MTTSIITSTRASKLSKSIYDPIEPDVFDQLYGVNGISCGVIDHGPVTSFSFAGTQNLHDKLVDAESDFTVKHDSRFGHIVESFFKDMEEMLLMLLPHIKAANSIVINGHSLGACHAGYLGLLIINLTPYRVSALDLFEPPRFIDRAAIAQLVAKIARVRAFRNGNTEFRDLIPDFPTSPLLDQFSLIAIDAPPKNPFNLIGWHEIDRIVEGVTTWELLYEQEEITKNLPF